MIDTLRHWHWTLLHRVFGLPEHDHTEPGAPLSVVLRSHPPVPTHGQHFAQPKRAGLHAQLERERQRQPRILKGWQQAIGTAFERQATRRHVRDGQRSES